MSYIKEIFEKMDLRHIGEFILNSTGNASNSNESYEDRLKTATAPIYKRLESVYQDADELNIATAELYKAFNAYEEVYMEIGMKAGARLLNQLLHRDDAAETKEAAAKRPY